MTTIYWLTKDLRLDDNPALNAALEHGQPLILAYWLDSESAKPLSGAALWWLQQSLKSLDQAIAPHGGSIAWLEGNFDEFTHFIEQHKGQHITCSASNEPHLNQQQRRLHEWGRARGIGCQRFAGAHMTHPDTIKTRADTPFKVFTPYYKNCLNHLQPPQPKSNLSTALWAKHKQPLPHTSIAGWQKKLSQHWHPGESGALQQFQSVIDGLDQYEELRNLPSQDGTSQLSPHLSFGEISPRRIWQEAINRWPTGEAQPFLRQLIWRDFGSYLLHHFPATVSKPFNPRFERFTWQNNQATIKQWQQGLTGYPLIDAGMRQLWETGWMHNRVRMAVGSFLTKHLRQHWHAGADWFWDTLVDADLGNNTAGWQWIAGCGADAAPYVRIFNPITQSEKFDANGDYIRTYLPELAALPKKIIHTPWLYPSECKKLGVTIGEDYPAPMIDHKQARQVAIEAYSTIKAG